MRPIFIILSCMLLSVPAWAQKWFPGHFYDAKGVKNVGFIAPAPSGKGPIKDEAFIEFKETEKDKNPIKLSASDIRSFVIGIDSFIVAYPPSDGWAATNLGFLRVAFDGPLKLYSSRGGFGGKRKVAVSPGVSAGVGSGGYGSGAGGSLAVSIGDGGANTRLNYLYGENASKLQLLTSENFADVMSEVMGDEPAVVEKIREKKFGLGNIESLIDYFYKVRAARGRPGL